VIDTSIDRCLTPRPNAGQAPQPYVAFLHKVLSGLLYRLADAERRAAIDQEQCDRMTDEAGKMAVELADLRSRLRVAEGIAHGMDCVATSSEIGVLELLAEVDRLKALVVALWQGGEWLWREVDEARSWAGRFALGGQRVLLEAARLDLELEAERGKAWRAWQTADLYESAIRMAVKAGRAIAAERDTERAERAKDNEGWRAEYADLEERFGTRLETARARYAELRRDADDTYGAMCEYQHGRDLAREALLAHVASLAPCHACGEAATGTTLLPNRRAYACDAHGSNGDLPRAEVVRAARRCLDG
jgi:hypothetical protein